MAITKVPDYTDKPAQKPASALQSTPTRISSIDILRALTMLLMIFVNDLWSLRDIPTWLEHTTADVDGMGLADVVFPAFLFIVGMSIPFAVANRIKKGDSKLDLMRHIGSRSLALLVMGLFLVNGDYLNTAATGIQRPLWFSLSCFSFILIWNMYPKTLSRWISRTLQMLGIGILLTLAFSYRGGEAADLSRFSIHWWGILGLIGWSYLLSALLCLFCGKRYHLLIAAWALFCVLSMLASSKLIPAHNIFSLIPSPILGGTLPAFTLGGVLITYLFLYFRKQNAPGKLMLILLFIATGLILLGFITRPIWGIAKLGETPPWLFICTAISILAFMAIYWLADLKKKAHWFNSIKPGGTDTLLCYLIPYFAYAAVGLSGFSWSELTLSGGPGLLKSFVFAFLCIWLAGKLSKIGIRLKL